VQNIGRESKAPLLDDRKKSPQLTGVESHSEMLWLSLEMAIVRHRVSEDRRR
jgi:hypothetical protein